MDTPFGPAREFRAYSVDFDIEPEFGTLWLNDANVCPVYGSDTAQGRFNLAIGHDRVLDEHGLFRGGGEAGLPGKFRDQIPRKKCRKFFGSAQKAPVQRATGEK